MEELRAKVEGKFNEILKSEREKMGAVLEDTTMNSLQRLDARQRIQYGVHATQRAMSAVMSIFDEFETGTNKTED